MKNSYQTTSKKEKKMEFILDKHKQSFEEIRKLCFQCYGLGLTSSYIFSESTYKNPSEQSKSALHSLLSASLLHLAISIRINLYQDTIDNHIIPLESMAADYYENDKLISRQISIKDVCDKIIHADSVKKPIFKDWPLERHEYITIQLRGLNKGKEWTLNLCLELFAQLILEITDKAEKYSL